MCVSVGVHCTQVSGGLRMSFMSQFSAAIMCVLEIQLRSSGLCGKLFGS